MHPVAHGPCPNCGGADVREYCAQCGQRAVDLRPTVHDLLHDALHEFSHVDSKMVRTAYLLVCRPGALTREFFEGKRARSVTPIRLYLLCSLLFFGVVSVMPQRKLHVAISGGDAQLQRAAARVNRDPSILVHAMTAAFPKAMFVLMPLFGLIVYAFYFRAERMYVPHLYFAVHYHAFAFVALALFEALGAIHNVAGAIARLIVFLSTVPYLAFAARRVYGGTRLVTWLKTAGIMTLYGTFVVLTMAAIAYVTMRRLQS
jgi:hypothetical protein